MDFIEAAKRRDEKVWGQILEITKDALKRFKKEKDDIEQDDVVSITIAKLMEQIDAYEPERGKGNIEANFISWINKTTEFEVMHARERRIREVRNISLQNLVSAIMPDENDEKDKDPHTMGENILSFIQYAQDEISINDPESRFMMTELIDAIMEFGDSRIKMVNILHYLYGMTTKEVAKIMNVKESAVNNWIQRYKKDLIRYLKGKGIDETYFD
ncbi:MAG: sigma-70 family RNA polymerase sigma factor [Syntrophorhabdaceae bacterium]|nr:sigma-70 family RNA polymerase sigma factor [Syntrophorhabdaceae bacterium]